MVQQDLPSDVKLPDDLCILGFNVSLPSLGEKVQKVRVLFGVHDKLQVQNSLTSSATTCVFMCFVVGFIKVSKMADPDRNNSIGKSLVLLVNLGAACCVLETNTSMFELSTVFAFDKVC